MDNDRPQSLLSYLRSQQNSKLTEQQLLQSKSGSLGNKMHQSITYHSFHWQRICLNKDSYMPKDICKFKPERHICSRSERQPGADEGIESRSPKSHVSTIIIHFLSSCALTADVLTCLIYYIYLTSLDSKCVSRWNITISSLFWKGQVT